MRRRALIGAGALLAAPALAGAPRVVRVGATKVGLDVPASRAQEITASEPGYVNAFFGEPGAAPCVVAVEVYDDRAKDRPASAAMLAQSLSTDHVQIITTEPKH